jgi:hypothetical protein
VATFADLAIDRVGAGYTLVVSAPTLASATSVPFAITPAPATQLAFTGQPSNATQNGPIAPAVAVTAFDAFGNVDTSFGGPVTVAISPGTGTLGARLSGTTTVAASSGVATFGDLRIDSSGTSYALDAAATGLGSATSEAFAVVPAAVELRITAQPTGAQAGASIAPPVVVTAFDGTGAVATGFSGTVTVALGANPTGGTLSGTRTVTAIAGVATFADLAIDRVGAGYTLVASSGILTPATSNAFSIVPGPATQLVFTVQPSDTPANQIIAPPVQVTALDNQGNVATGFTGTVTVELGGNPRGAVLSGTLSVSAIEGVATFADLAVDRSRSGLVLVALAPALTSATSDPFNVLR